MKALVSLLMRWRCFSIGAPLTLIVIAVFALGALMIQDGVVAAQEPLRATNRFVSTFPVSAAPAQYDLVNQILDFEPGAFTRQHRHGGPAFVTVLEGQITRREGNVDTVFGPGQTFTEPAGVLHSVGNRGNVKARVFSSYLLSPGEPQTLNDPNSPGPDLLPVVAFRSQTTVTTQPAEFNLTQVVVDFAPGAVLPEHIHGGPGLAMVTNGELAFRTSVGEVRLRPGETYTDIGAAHDTRNAAAGPASVVVTFLIRKGEPLTTFLTTAPPPASAPAIRPPATGDGGLAPDQQETVLDALFMGSLSGLALVVVAKRVHTARRGPQV